jgi:hypothetical protein
MIDTRREPTFSRTWREPPPSRTRRRRSSAPVAWALVVLLLLGAAWYVFSDPDRWTPSRSMAEGPAPAAPTPPAPVAERPSLLLPAGQDVLQAGDVQAALTDLLGRDAVLRFLEAADFPRRLVATVDNLGRDHAPVASWPVQPPPGRFVGDATGGSQRIAAENALRYAPFVGFASAVPTAQAVDLYRRMYPLLQQQYGELGFGARSFHARVLDVIDLLLATPEPAQPPQITLTEVRGPIPSAQPWTRYEFVDPALQRLTSGQKMLLRMGPENREVLKGKLREVREALLAVSAPPARP